MSWFNKQLLTNILTVVIKKADSHLLQLKEDILNQPQKTSKMRQSMRKIKMKQLIKQKKNLQTALINLQKQEQIIKNINEQDNPEQYKKKISQLGKSIRSKVKKNQLIPIQSPKTMAVYKSRLIKFQGNESQIIKENNYQRSERGVSIIQQQESPTRFAKKIIKSIINQALKQAQQTPKRLSFDNKKYVYPITSFRRRILEEDKIKSLQKSKVLKEKQAILFKRRQIYKASRNRYQS